MGPWLPVGKIIVNIEQRFFRIYTDFAYERKIIDGLSEKTMNMLEEAKTLRTNVKQHQMRKLMDLVTG